MKKQVFIFWVFAAFLSACGNRMSPEQLSQKLDSIRMVEQAEQLRLQGINLEEVNPIQAFFDSLNVQPLPLRSTEDYVFMLPRFQSIPSDIAHFLQLGNDNGKDVKAVLLPEAMAARLMIVAVPNEQGYNSLWLYSLGEDFLPVDRLLIYSPMTIDDFLDRKIAEFSITSDYEIKLREVNGKSLKQTQTVHGYYISPDRHFMKH